MECAFCGYGLAPGATECSRCGGKVANPQKAGSDLFDGPTSADPTPMGSSGVGVALRSGRPADDPESNLHTSVLSQDRQANISTKMVELPPPAQEPVPLQQKGLPDSRVARGVEDSLLEIKRLLFRMGRLGRLALWSHVVVIIGSVSPWYYLPYEGFTPGLEAWGWLTLVLSIGGIATLAWRHQPTTGMRVVPVLLHLLVAAALILMLLWRYQAHTEIGEHLRPNISLGFYITTAGALGASLGAMLGLKNVR